MSVLYFFCSFDLSKQVYKKRTYIHTAFGMFEKQAKSLCNNYL
jgi:hypothetical protein